MELNVRDFVVDIISFGVCLSCGGIWGGVGEGDGYGDWASKCGRRDGGD